MPLNMYFTNSTTNETVHLITAYSVAIGNKISNACNVTMSLVDQCTGTPRGGALLCPQTTHNADGIPTGGYSMAQIFRCDGFRPGSTYTCINTFFNNMCISSESLNTTQIVAITMLSALGLFGVGFGAYHLRQYCKNRQPLVAAGNDIPLLERAEGQEPAPAEQRRRGFFI
jgi:hypothetical protein